MKQIWTGPVSRTAGKYAENAQTAAVCCNACRTCVTSNILGVVMAVFAGTGYGVAGFVRRRLNASS